MMPAPPGYISRSPAYTAAWPVKAYQSRRRAVCAALALLDRLRWHKAGMWLLRSIVAGDRARFEAASRWQS
jgi:hypothetical protein